MLTGPTSPLPAFDQAQLDRRFLAELHRLLEVGILATYADWTRTLGVNVARVSEIEKGRYHCSLKLLYDTLRHYPGFDYQYVLFGSAVYARPEPTSAPKRRRGPQPGTTRRERASQKPETAAVTQKPTP